MQQALKNIVGIITVSGVPLGIFVALVLNSGTRRASKANFFLTLLILGLAFSLLHSLAAGSVLSHFSITSFAIGDPTLLIIAPFLWFYVSELTGTRGKFSVRELSHFIPFVLICILSLIRKTPFQAEDFRWVNIGFWIFAAAQFTVYQIFIHRRWRLYQRWINREMSNTENLDIGWVRFFLMVFMLINLFFVVNLIVTIHMPHVGWQNSLVAVVFSLSIFALGYKGILQQQAPATPEENLSEPTLLLPEKKFVDEDLKQKLLRFMDEHKPYLNAELTLSDLARQLNISRGKLSELINEGTGNNFYDFVNTYRVDEVKRSMADPTKNKYSLLGLAMDAGFKSKSTFNLIFKRVTGLTPTEYKRNQML